MKRAILTTAAAVAALLALTFAIVVVAAFGNTNVRPLTMSTGTITLIMFLVALVALLIAAAAAEWTGWARPSRRDASPNRRRLLAIPITTGASRVFSGAASHAGGPSAAARTAASRAATPFTGAYGTPSANPTPRLRAPTPSPTMSTARPSTSQPSERTRRSRAPWALSVNPASPPAPEPDPVRQPAEPPTSVAALAAAFEASPRSDPDRRRLVREFREEARSAAAPSEPDPPSTPEPTPKPDPVSSPAHADVPPPTADLPPAVERSPRPSASGRLRRHLPWLIQRQGGNCGICRQPLPEPPKGDVVHVDHIVPLVRGGTDQRSNLQATHAACNLTKGSQGARRPPPGYSSPELPPH